MLLKTLASPGGPRTSPQGCPSTSFKNLLPQPWPRCLLLFHLPQLVASRVRGGEGRREIQHLTPEPSLARGKGEMWAPVGCFYLTSVNFVLADTLCSHHACPPSPGTFSHRRPRLAPTCLCAPLVQRHPRSSSVAPRSRPLCSRAPPLSTLPPHLHTYTRAHAHRPWPGLSGPGWVSPAVLKLLKMATGMRALLDTVVQALPQVRATPPGSPPGSHWCHSGLHFLLLQPARSPGRILSPKRQCEAGAVGDGKVPSAPVFLISGARQGLLCSWR